MSSAWADNTELQFSLNELYQNGTLVTTKTVINTSGGTLTFTDKDENFTILLTRNSGNQPGYYTSSGYIRFYSSDTFKLTAADGITISKVVVTSNGSSFSLSTMDGLDTSKKTWTGSASEVTFTGSGTNKWDKLTITYSTSGGSEVPSITANDINIDYNTTIGSIAYTLNNATGNVTAATTSDWLTLGTPTASEVPFTCTANTGAERTATVTLSFTGATDKVVTVTQAAAPISHTATFSVNGVITTQDFEEGADITFPSNPADINDKKFVGWVTAAIDGTTNEVPSFVTSATMGEADVTYYAVFASVGGESGWIETALANMAASDIFVFSNGDYAMTNDNSTSSAPSATSITVESSKVTSNVDDNLKWNVSGNATDGYVFYPNGSTTTWLYCNTTAASGSNNNIRVGTGDRKVWKFDDSGYLVTNDDKTGRYLSLYNSQDFRGYINTENGAFVPKFYKYSSGTITGYCTTVVAAAVEKPVITLGANPFLFSTTATITCETDGATIKYSYDGENWNDYSSALTITETKTIFAKAIKGNDESSVAQVTATKNLAESTVTIDATGITNTNVYAGTAAGSLAASVTYNDAAVEGASVTWSGNNDEVATINASTGAVTLVAAGSVTFTATFAGNGDYSEKAATYNMTVTNDDPNAPGTENNPYTVAQAIAATPSSGTSDDVYIHGIVSSFHNTSITGDGSNYRYYISDDGSTSGQLLVFKGKGTGNVAFSDDDDLRIGDIVTIKGGLTTYNSTKEVAANNYIVSHKLVAPTFSPVAGEVTSGTNVTISDAHTEATIYYTTDETNPTTESPVYSAPIEITSATTLKAIAVKTGYSTSDVATAAYTINVTPSITITADDPVNVSSTDNSGELALIYENLTISAADDFDVQFYDANDDEISEPDWIEAVVEQADPSGYKVSYVVEANDGAARTAYFKVFALGTTDYVYSNKVTITQAEYVPTTTYSLATTVTSGKTYIIASGKSGSIYAMGYDKGNNRDAVAVNAVAGQSTSTITVTEDAGVYELVLYGPDANGYYTFYDANHTKKENNVDVADPGYLYAVGGSNYLKTHSTNDAYGKWSISFGNTTNNAIVTAPNAVSGNTARVMRFNNGNSKLFSCYTSGQSDIYLYEKDGDTPLTTTASVKLNAYGYATLASTNTLDFLDADADGVEYSAWQITGVTGNEITFGQIKSTVAAGKGILLKGTPGATININILPVGGETLSSNKLVGITTATAVADDEYFGLKGNMFVKVNAGTVPAGKALLPASVVAGARELTFDFGGETNGISDIKHETLNMNGAMYDMQGRKVEKPGKGMYIMNGKKVIFK